LTERQVNVVIEFNFSSTGEWAVGLLLFAALIVAALA
jgi:hypothetical protein